MTTSLIRGNARCLPLADRSVDLIVTSPPYYAQRSYTDDGEHWPGQIGAEPTPALYVDALLEVTAECLRVLKPTGSLWVNLGDKYAERAGPSWDGSSDRLTSRPPKPRRASTTSMAPRKSLLGLPWRYALRCIDELGLILRAEVVWSKTNGLPESVTDRVRRSHETWFHFTAQPHYFSATDNLREPHAPVSVRRARPHRAHPGRRGPEVYGGSAGQTLDLARMNHPLGRLPGSVWEIATQPLNVPEHLGADHYAAFPMEWPRRLIRGWSPHDGVVLDPFGGTGTTALVASVLGRHGVSVEGSADYCRIAAWRTTDPGQRAAAQQVDRPRAQADGQLDIFDGGGVDHETP